MNELVLTVGLPRSGKSTWAMKQGVPVVNPDSIRLALHGQAFVPSAEKVVWATADLMVRALFKAGHEKVILDSTNLTMKRRPEWAGKGEWAVTTKAFYASSYTCIQRAKDTEQDYLVPVIERMRGTIEWPLFDNCGD